jgi:amidophosphoribosyltransferase
VSSAPQIRYPVATVLIWLVGRTSGIQGSFSVAKEKLISYSEECIKCKSQENFLDSDVVNYVTAIYEPFTAHYLIKIAEMLSSRNKAEVKIIFQTVEDLYCLS